MKSIRKFALVLLFMVMLFTLTSCGGSNGTPSIDEQLTTRTNEKLAPSNIQVTYDSTLNEKLVTYLTVYFHSGSESAAFEAAELDAAHYEIYTVTSNNTVDHISSVLAQEIKGEKATSGRIAKTIGYASAKSTAGSPILYAIVQYS